MAAKAIDLSTAGIMVGYAIETVAGTKPSAFTNIPNPKSIPDTNPEPSTYDSTSLNATEWKTYVEGLRYGWCAGNYLWYVSGIFGHVGKAV